jgi:hypothetical protein
MGKKRHFRVLVWIACVLATQMLFLVPARGADEDSEFKFRGEGIRYQRDRVSFQVLLGALSALSPESDVYDDFEYAQMNVRLGWILDEPGPHWFLPNGNLEALFELSNSLIYDGYGSYIGGVTVLLRYNFLEKYATCTPYAQAGAGVVYTDAYQEKDQIAIGQAIEFTPQASFGFRYHIRERWTMDFEFMVHHISNANLAERNRGINAIGGFLGLTYFSNWTWRNR